MSGPEPSPNQLPAALRRGGPVRTDQGAAFEVQGTLGRGAMGVVLSALDAQTGQPVAIKLSRRDADSDPRLRREGELVAALDHPGIVRVLGYGSIEGWPYLAYELVAGARTFEELLPSLERDGRLAILVDVAEAVAHAHGRGVVHRDLKPGNVLIDATGRPRIADFGLGRADWEGLERLTETGMWVGTPQYSAPEQISRHQFGQPSPATDVWALGVILYRCLTDRLPFDARELIDLVKRIITGDFVPPRKVALGVSAQLERVCCAALTVDPAGRYPDAWTFAAALQAARAAR